MELTHITEAVAVLCALIKQSSTTSITARRAKTTGATAVSQVGTLKLTDGSLANQYPTTDLLKILFSNFLNLKLGVRGWIWGCQGC